MNFADMFNKIADDIANAAKKIADSVANGVAEIGLTDFSGYRLVLALSDGLLNRQLRTLHNRRRKDLDKPWKLTAKDHYWEVQIEELGVPQVDFDTDVINGCRLIIPIIGGTIRYFEISYGDEETPKLAKLKVDDLTITATVDVSKIRHKGWNPNDLNAAAIFADFSAIVATEVTLSRDVELTVGDSIAKDLALLIGDELKLQGNSHPLQSLFDGLLLHPKPGHVMGDSTYRPTGYTYSTTVARSRGTYQFGVLNVLFLTEGITNFPDGATAGEIDAPLTSAGDGHLVLSGATLLVGYGLPVANKVWEDIPLQIRRGRCGHNAPELYLNKTWGFGVTVNGRGRSAYMGEMKGVYSRGEIRFKGYYDTSAYRAWPMKDKKFREPASIEIEVDGWSFDLPGQEIFVFRNIRQDDHLKVQVGFR
ncbi:MAG TPA: hypothetical protein DHC76_20370 [Rhodobacteraceae bacterium]|jgi:hypothetical protein|nr:hypothetical protein RB2083_3130 [Rhodobacteraceae bacterium HTCC2083]HCW86333.1 hypothetical protein [Paracoccaceae bacterium]